MELIEEPIGRSPSPARAKQLLEATRREGLLIGLGGMRGNVVRLGPSMLISEDEIEEAAGKFERACEAVDG
jgi:malonate-semialdehyde dehydrogenase (acetylating)/methylmalonate-semialdehyde dehydrogenase/4-aminobutyrate aminotransferase